MSAGGVLAAGARSPYPSGSPYTFRCAACAQHRPLQGRKKRRVLGMQTWVCRACGDKGRA